MSGAEIVRKSVDALNKHDAKAFASLYAEDAVVYDPYYPEPLRGRDAVEKDMVGFFVAFPDLHNAVRTTLEGDGIVAAEFVIDAGVHKGPLPLPSGDIPATGKTLIFDGSVFSRLNSQGQIIEEHRYYDIAGQLEQLGLSN